MQASREANATWLDLPMLEAVKVEILKSGIGVGKAGCLDPPHMCKQNLSLNKN
jgi:hypothetical protein